jgi:hypothetical protein
MKKWILILLMLATASSLLLHADSNPYLKDIEKSHQAGEYNKFLKSLDEEYKKAGKAGVLSAVFAEMKKWRAAGDAELFQDFRVKEICQDHSDAEVCKKIETIASLSLSDRQMEAVKFFHSLKGKKVDQDLHNPENRLAAIQTEYEIKMTLLRLALARKEPKALLDPKKKIVITLEKFKKMEEAAAKFEDPKWSQLVQDAKEAFIHSYEARSEFAYLKDLASGKIAPKDPVEEKLKTVVHAFLARSE